MKKIITLVLLAVTMTAQAQTHLDPYQPLMDAIDKQGEDILSQYRALQEKDPKGELPESKAKAKILSDRLDSLRQIHQGCLVSVKLRGSEGCPCPAHSLL